MRWDRNHFERVGPASPSPWPATAWLGLALAAAILAVTLPLPWHPMITFAAVMALGAGDRWLRKPRRPRPRP